MAPFLLEHQVWSGGMKITKANEFLSSGWVKKKRLPGAQPGKAFGGYFLENSPGAAPSAYNLWLPSRGR